MGGFSRKSPGHFHQNKRHPPAFLPGPRHRGACAGLPGGADGLAARGLRGRLAGAAQGDGATGAQPGQCRGQWWWEKWWKNGETDFLEKLSKRSRVFDFEWILWAKNEFNMLLIVYDILFRRNSWSVGSQPSLDSP